MSEEFVGWLDDEWNVVLDQSQPIVRCRDCRFKAKDGDWCYRTDHEFPIDPNGFCSRGEGKENHAC